MTLGAVPGVDGGPPRQGWLRRLSWIAVLAAGVIAYLLVLQTMLDTRNPNFLPSLLLLGSIVVPATVLVFAASGGRQVLVSPGLITLVAVVGGVIGTVAAGTLEYDALVRLRGMSIIVVGLIEEAVKLIVPVAVLIVVRLRKSSAVSAEAGVIMGVASGMGFATLETMGYGFSALLQSGSVLAVEQTLLLRAILSPAGHVAWTGMAAAAIWAMPGAARPGRAVLRAIGTFVLVVVLHTAWDGFDNDIVRLVVGVFSFVALLIVIHRAHVGARVRRRQTSSHPYGAPPQPPYEPPQQPPLPLSSDPYGPPTYNPVPQGLPLPEDRPRSPGHP